MVVKRKVSLGGDAGQAKAKSGPRAATEEVLDLFFNTGVIFHEVVAGELPDLVSGFVLMKQPEGVAAGATVRRAQAGEEPDIEISALEHMAQLSHRWLPVPYQLSAQHAVQVFLGGEDPRAPRILMAIDTLERQGSAGRHLDATLDEGRPFRPLDKNECYAFLDHPTTRELLRKMERAGDDRAPFKLAALL